MDHSHPCNPNLTGPDPVDELLDDPVPVADVPDQSDVPDAVTPEHERSGPDALDLASLRRVMATQPAIEQAKGMLMAYFGVDDEQAFALLSRWSSRRHTKVRHLAHDLVAVAALPDPVPFGSLQRYLKEHLPGS